MHFQFLNTGVGREAYIDKLEKEIRKHLNHETFKYEKKSPAMYQLLKDIGNEDFAKKNAHRLREHFSRNKNYDTHNPCTTVDLLVDELEHPEKVLAELNA